MIEYQIERPIPAEQRLLGAASAAGAQWSAALLAAALGADAVEIECSCEALARRGQMLTAAGVEEWPDGTVAGRYAFLHALYAEVLYQRLTPAQRVELHGCLGKRLESAYGERAGEIAAELALHFEQGRDPARGVRYLRQAGEHAVRRFANREALGYLGRALELVERLPGARRVEQRIELLQQRGWVRRSMGDIRGAVEDLSAVLSNAREASQRLAEVRALLDLSRIYAWVDRRRSLELAERAVARSDDLPDALMKALVRGNCASLNIHFRGWREEDAQACRLSLEVTRQTQNPRMQNRRLIILSMLECTSSNYQAACVAAEEGMQVAQGLGDAYMFMVCQGFRAWALLHVGAWGEMRRSLAAALITAERNANRQGSTYYRLEIAWLHAEALDFEGARSGCEQSVESALQAHDLSSYFLGQNLLAKANLGLQDYPRAFECFNEITRRVEDEGLLMESILHPLFHQGLCEYWLAQGDLGQAQREAALLCELAALPPERTYLAIGHSLLAQIALAERRWEEAQSQLARALEIVEGAEVPLAAWRVYATAAAFRQRQGRPSEAEGYRCRGAE
ncbi:MAG: transcriptional regulator, partial [Gammaproteobacteria bacterium]